MYYEDNNYTLVALTGEQVPDMPTGIVYDELRFPQHREQNIVIFDSDIAGPSITDANNRVWWQISNAGLIPIVREGNPLPDPSGTSVVVGTASVMLGYRSDYCLVTQFAGSSERGLWHVSPALIYQKVAREDDAAPETETGTFFISFIHPVIDGKGRIVFYSQLDGPNTNSSNWAGIWRGSSYDNLELVIRKGDQMPGLPDGIAFSTTNPFKTNSVGNIAFTCNVSGSGVNTTNNTVTYFTTNNDQLIPVVRTGDVIDVSRDGMPSDLRTVEFIRLYAETPEVGLRSQLNDNGELVYYVRFTDGSQAIFVASVATDCPADTNGDGMVTPADFSAWVAAFNAQAPECDQNGDGACSPADFSAWVANYNTGC